MSSKLEQIRAKLKNLDNSQSRNNQAKISSAYPFWDMPFGQTAVVRFLPDKDEDNTFFWVEKQIIRIPFTGIKGDRTSKPFNIEVPCVEMWGESCPILKEVRPWWNDESLKEMAKRYWKKRSYIFQGFVVADPLAEKEVPENPIRKFVVNSQLFNTIKAALLDPEITDTPTDYLNGINFRITKTKQGEYANYATSSWARNSSSLSEEQLAAVEKYGLFELASFLPKRPDAEALEAIYEMFAASVDGNPYDPDRWGKFYRPYGMEIAGRDAQASNEETKDRVVSKPAMTKTEEASSDIPWEDTATKESAPTTTKKDPKDLLAKLRNREQ